MRSVYLIRHGEPDFPDGQRLCLGLTDLPLSTLGRLQGVILGAFMPAFEPGHIFSSPLIRTRETAAFMGPFAVLPELHEINMECWEGQTFSDMEIRYPELWAKRQTDPLHTRIPGAETPAEGGRRLYRSLENILSHTDGDIAIVAHRGIIRSFLCHEKLLAVEDYIDQIIPYTGVTKLILDRGVLMPEYIGLAPSVGLTRELSLQLLKEAGITGRNLARRLFVEKEALRLAKGKSIDAEFLCCASLLNGLIPDGPCREQSSADILVSLGFAKAASFIRGLTDAHPDSPEAAILREAEKNVPADSPMVL